MSSRRRVNTLSHIVVNDVVIKRVPGIREAVFNHFRSVRVARPSIANLQFNSIIEADAYYLERPFDEEEVKQAVWECDNFKSPGPDGINFGFIKDLWADIKGDFMRFLLEFYSNGRLVKGSNYTLIVLITKVENPQRIADYRPISLVGCMYKVLAKVLANRLKSVIGKVTSETQSTFVKDRQILDGILIANEVVDDAMQWIMTCVSTATVSMLVNGSSTNEFTSIDTSLFKGYRVGTKANSLVYISHLQFADDTLIVGEKSWANIRVLKANLTLFELISGLKVNFHKSILVGVNIAEAWLRDAASVLNCKLGHIPFLYLGLPIGGNANRNSFWSSLVDKIRCKLSLWKSRYLSMGGRLEPESLWFKVLAAKYEMRDVGGNKTSSWWKDINSIRFGNDVGVGSWFGDNVVKRLGDGEKTLFWKDNWVDGTSLKSQFGRLYDLCLDKKVTVVDMRRLGWELGGNEWRWRRRLFAWEEQLWGDCCTIVANVVLQFDSPDVWEWIPDHDTCYLVGGAYHPLTHMYPREMSPYNDLIWNKLVPSKVSTFAWRFINDRYSSSIFELPRFWCGLECHHFWLGITCVLPDNAMLLASQFSRNDKVFNGKRATIDRLIFTINFQAWWWFQARKKGFCIGLNTR
ncbi:cysteine-rich receptor-like protein kinase [Trifolium pratense]|uniref:Cysteine-rich receptor-like protein kinase n=1 Tax=Trifolium pratense TaxID=57577 RepID=A0A2K3P0M6_TRIPR|nr:cysteine-rich receptor-like protein kinase [Trifolium pratense]